LQLPHFDNSIVNHFICSLLRVSHQVNLAQYLHKLNQTVYVSGCAVGITTGELILAGGSCYQVVADTLSRQAARDICASGGGSLGVIPNNLTLTEVGNRVKERSESGSLSSTIFWLGMNVTRGRLLAENGNVNRRLQFFSWSNFLSKSTEIAYILFFNTISFCKIHL
jgi:hypothetical protein